jgi:hypothetical protein
MKATPPNRAMAGADNNSDAALAALVLATVPPVPVPMMLPPPLLEGDDDVSVAVKYLEQKGGTDAPSGMPTLDGQGLALIEPGHWMA